MATSRSASVTEEPQLTVVVMAFNEMDTLREVVHDSLQELKRIGVPFEVLIVDDGSTDATGAVAASLSAEQSAVRTVRHPRNGGLGRVYRTGFTESRGRIVTFFPADGQFPAQNITRLYEGLLDHDLALGYLAERQDGAAARLLSQCERALYRALLGPMPRFQGLLMFRRALLDEVPLTSSGRGWGVLMELVLRLSRGGYKVASILTVVRPRLAGRSKVRNLRTILANLRQVLALRRELGRSREARRESGHTGRNHGCE